MGTYFNDDAKRILNWIVEIWLEKVAENEKLPESERRSIAELAPTATEFDNNPRCSLKANSLPINCNKWNSFSEAVKSLKSHVERVVAARNAGEKEPDPPPYLKLAPKPTIAVATPNPTAPSATKAKPTPKKRTNPKPKKTTQEKPIPAVQPVSESTTPQKAVETPQSAKTPVSPTPVAKAPEKTSKPAPMYRKFNFGSNDPNKRPTQKRDPHATLTQTIGSMIPPEIFDKIDTAEEPPKAKKSPTKKTSAKSTKPTEPKQEPKISESASRATELTNDFTKLSITNYLPGKLAFITKDYYLACKKGDILPGQSHKIALDGDDSSFAKVIKAKKILDRYAADSTEGILEITLTEVYCVPKIEKRGIISDFPEPKEGHLLLVEKEVAEAARSNGRSTDDLIFPRYYLRTDNNLFLCVELGKL